MVAMAEDLILSEKEVFEQAGAGLVAWLALAAQNSNAPLPVQGAMAMAGSLVGLGFGRSVFRAATRRFPKFARGFLRAGDPDPVRAGEKAKAMAEKGVTESLDDIMMRSFRQMMDAVDDEVVPVLGYMAGLYGFERKKPDVFFRGLGRLLCDLEAGELEQLGRIVKLASTEPLRDATLQIGGTGVQLIAKNSLRELRLPAAERLFGSLKREGLGKERFPSAEENDDPMYPYDPNDWIVIEIAVRDKLARVLKPA
jgi:hypothetical protein